jgi:hypothetical protein
MTPCANGCAASTSSVAAHCRVFDPLGPIEPSDMDVAGAGDSTFFNVKFNTDTGAITSDDGATILRAANTNPVLQEVLNGIGFRRVDGQIGIFQFNSLTIDKAEVFHVNGATGSVALGLVAKTTLTINGVLDLGCPTSRPFYVFPSAGSSPGGNTPGDGQGAGGGKQGLGASGYPLSGGGGGGHGATGGNGGVGRLDANTGGDTAGGAFGPANDDTAAPKGGSGGGSTAAGKQTTQGFDTALGGAGGGAVHLVAGGQITIGSGTAGTGNGVDAAEGVNVGGCAGNPSFQGPAGGGGSGGSIFVEAPIVVGKANAGLAANGGGGGGGTEAQHGFLSKTQSAGGNANGCFGKGGKGGANDSPGGEPGDRGPTVCASGYDNRLFGGGGGGAVGLIRVRTLTGTFTPDANFVVSLSPTLPAGNPAYTKGPFTLR